MTGRFNFWELAGAASAMGGTGVWVFALAARAGVLRGLLEAFPRSTWDAVTWVLIPALMLAPAVLQGVGVAWVSDVRPAPIGQAVGGAVGGTLLAILVLGFMFAIVRVPVQVTLGLVPILSELFVVCFLIVLATGWLMIAARVPALAGLRRAALLVALPAVTVAWAEAHAKTVSLVYVLDQHELTGLFAAVAIGGALGSTWIVRRDAGGGARLSAVREER